METAPQFLPPPPASPHNQIHMSMYLMRVTKLGHPPHPPHQKHMSMYLMRAQIKNLYVISYPPLRRG